MLVSDMLASLVHSSRQAPYSMWGAFMCSVAIGKQMWWQGLRWSARHGLVYRRFRDQGLYNFRIEPT